MRNITLLTSTMLFLPMTAMAQNINCTPSPDCASLGYTESSCPDGAGVKCPWGNAWFCTEEKCDTSYQYTCSGTGYAGGSGDSCGGKYTSCTCADGYEWKDETCQKEILKPEWGKCNGSAKNCNIGDILYSDGTCSPQNISGKTPIAVVVYKSSDGNCAQAMALKSIGFYKWGGSGVSERDISTLQNFLLASAASQDLASCENTAKIIAVGDKSKYPAAWAAHEYKTVGTNAGDWCLPAAGIMTSIKNDMELINIGYGLVSGTKIGTSSYFWSSSKCHDPNVWYSYFSFDYGLASRDHLSGSYYEVRPVLEF